MSRSTQILRYIIRRLFQAVPIVLAIIVLNFFLLNMAEGDAVDVLAGEAGSATPEYMAELRAKFGLDQPLPVQLLVYLKNIISLDLGYSFRHDMPVSVLIVDRFWPTLLLMVSTSISNISKRNAPSLSVFQEKEKRKREREIVGGNIKL